MAREDINGISVPIPGTGEPADFVSDLRRIATDLSGSYASVVVFDGTWPTRPTNAASVHWFGPTEPPEMADDVDFWTEVL